VKKKRNTTIDKMIQRLPKVAADVGCKFKPIGIMESLVDAGIYVVGMMGGVGATGAITKAIAIAMMVASQRMLQEFPDDLSKDVSVLLGIVWRRSIG
jgi:hypothetical protein